MTSTSSILSFLQRREILATLTVAPLSYWYWTNLLESLDGNICVALLIIVGGWFSIAIDLNEHMIGQPEGDHDHHD